MKPHQLNNLHQNEGKKETISELAQRHMKDESHTTTDEELKNAEVVLTPGVSSDQEDAPGKDYADTVSSSVDNDKASSTKVITSPVPNPFDVLGS